MIEKCGVVLPAHWRVVVISEGYARSDRMMARRPRHVVSGAIHFRPHDVVHWRWMGTAWALRGEVSQAVFGVQQEVLFKLVLGPRGVFRCYTYSRQWRALFRYHCRGVCVGRQLMRLPIDLA